MAVKRGESRIVVITGKGKADGKSVVLGPTVTFSQRGAGSLSQTPIAGGPIETRAM